MKKILALVLAMLMLLSLVPTLAEYDEHITFSATYVDRGSTAKDAMYDFFCDQFNVDIEMIPIAWSALNDTNSVMIMGGTMYDWMMITWDYSTYRTYMEQGLIKPLPENFRELYPNIARAFDASGVGDYLYYDDGLAYGTPMPIFFNFASRPYSLNMMAVYYRVDWAEELGFDWGASVTVSEFEEYLRACVANDMCGNGQTIGLSSAGTIGMYMNVLAEGYNGFNLVDGQYVWGPTMDGVTDAIKYIKTIYEEGLIDPDFYALDTFSAQNKLPAGMTSALYQTGTATNYQIILDAAASAGMENAVEKIKPVMLTDENGVWHGGEVKNFWCINVFRPDLDDETYARILSLLDYLYSKEAEEVFNMGIKGVDWDVDAEGYYVSMLEEEYSNIREKYPSGWFWRDTAICLDEFDLVNPTYSKAVLDNINAVYDFRYQSAEKNGYRAIDNKVNFLNTEAMRNYSVDIDSEITRIVCDDTISMDDVEAQWATFIEQNAGLWQPVVNDLNAACAE